jgi:N-acetylglucosamine-1-phosphate uridyltransferase (contains nucleotidyltransferase and I-patch acetyltransferase domains)
MVNGVTIIDPSNTYISADAIVTEEESTYIGIQKESVEQTVIQNVEDCRLAYAVIYLPIKYREVIYLFYYEELPIIVRKLSIEI